MHRCVPSPLSPLFLAASTPRHLPGLFSPVAQGPDSVLVKVGDFGQAIAKGEWQGEDGV